MTFGRKDFMHDFTFYCSSLKALLKVQFCKYFLKNSHFFVSTALAVLLSCEGLCYSPQIRQFLISDFFRTGEVFVIRHDVNLHTEILDTPDFFW